MINQTRIGEHVQDLIDAGPAGGHVFSSQVAKAATKYISYKDKDFLEYLIEYKELCLKYGAYIGSSEYAFVEFIDFKDKYFEFMNG